MRSPSSFPPRSSPRSFYYSVKSGTKFRNETSSREEPRRTFYGILVLSHTGGLLGVGKRGSSVSGLSLAVEGQRVKGFVQLSWSQPCRIAYRTMSMRFFMPIFSIARVLYTSTVLTLMARRAAISLCA